jgi:hypothetical protein
LTFGGFFGSANEIFGGSPKSQSADRQEASRDDYPPIVRRFLLMILGLLGGDKLLDLGERYSDKGRHRVAIALRWLAVSGFGLSLFLWWASFFPWTWGWLL